MGNGLPAPVESPAALTLLAGWRRLSQQGLTEERSTVSAQPLLTSQTEDEQPLARAMAAVMVAAPAPTVGAPIRSPGRLAGC